MPKAYTDRLGQLKQLALSASAKQSAILFGGSLTAAVLGLLSVVIVSRKLGPASFGVLATFNAIVSTLLGLTDLGLGTTAVKLISAKLGVSQRQAHITMKIIFRIEILSGVLIGVVGLIFSHQVADLLGGPNLLTAVRLGFFASIFASAGAFINPFMISHGRFYANAAVGIVGPILKMAGILVLLTLAQVNLSNVIWLYTVVPIAAFFIGWAFSPRIDKTAPTPEETREAFFEVFHFSKWILLSYVANVITGKIDVFLISRYHGSAAVGLYSAAFQLASILPMVIAAVTSVLLPRVSKLKTPTEYLGYVKKVAAGCSLLFLVLLPVLIFGSFFIQLIFGAKYIGSLGVFTIVFASYLVSLFGNPISLVIYAVNKPKALAAINFIQLPVALALNLWLVPPYGIMGAAVAFATSNTLGAILSFGYALRFTRRREGNE